MGYELHITKANWVGNSGDNPIPSQRWLHFVEGDSELKLAGSERPFLAFWINPTADEGAWLDWKEGRIYTKSPNDALLKKMLQIAKTLGANVQGDDGEKYHRDGTVTPFVPTLIERLCVFLLRTFKRPPPLKPFNLDDFPFKVGDRVLKLRRRCTIVSIDPWTNGGGGSVQVRFDDNGRVGSSLLIAHGIEPLPSEETKS